PTFQQINTSILRRMVNGMKQEGHPYKGVIYAGLMLTDTGPMALEFNARFGDPETQPLMMLLSSDLAPILYACIEGTLKPEMVTFRDGAAVCVVLAEKGYPDNPHRGTIIHGLNTIQDPNIQVFHAGTIVRNGQIVTNGGRVLGITAWADDLPTARERAYSVIGPHGIYFDGMQYRTDIAKGL
ncbi:phosphoribosylamine--glycine ligase, partial [Candidatus Roizmanbacteria bacterium]|nr:phosphoribosylamine--glycine ligase [Candidatus Roizmanbacteria bacterium]